jgi:peroxiredoxin Q/BCP
MPIQVGDKAPNIKTTEFSLADAKGQRVVLFFFPKADTPGCTTEACEFRDAQKTFTKKNTVIVGISPDKPAAHAKFAAKYSLPYTLVPDPDHAIAEAYDVWKEKSMYGRKYMGVERTTFVIDEKGEIAKIFVKVKPAGHAAEVLEGLVK